MFFYNRPKKRSVTYTVVQRKAMLCLYNKTFKHKVLYKVILKRRKSFFLYKNSKITGT